MNDEHTYIDLLRDRALKVTNNRIRVLDTISTYGSAIPQSTIQQQLSDIDRVTLYRSLHTLIEHGIIHKATVDDKETYYAICNHRCTVHQHQHNHIHFKCSQCQEVSCLQQKEVTHISIPGYTIQDVNIEAIGICPKCKE